MLRKRKYNVPYNGPKAEFSWKTSLWKWHLRENKMHKWDQPREKHFKAEQSLCEISGP